jgi:aldehyde:ferredoxin oxidoreductase
VEIGERIFNLQRMFNVMAGFSREEDRLPARLHKELLKAGPPKDIPMSEVAFQQAMDEYYAFRGWDDQGRPTVAKLKALGIETEFISAYEESLK